MIIVVSYSKLFFMPFRFKLRLLYFYYLFVPILGPFLLFGYFVRLNKNILDGNADGFPLFGRFKENLKEGLKFFIVIIYFALLSSIVLLCFYSLGQLIHTYVADGLSLIGIFVLLCFIPAILVNYFRESNFKSLVSFKLAYMNLRIDFFGYLKSFCMDFLFKVAYLLIPILFLAGIYSIYFFGEVNSTNLILLIFLMGFEILSLLIFTPVLFFSKMTNICSFFEELQEE